MQGTLNTLRLDTQADDAFAQNIESSVLPNFGFGVYYYTQNFYVGASIPRILENYYDGGLNGGNTDGLARQKRHYDFIMGAMLKLGKKVKLKPSMLIKLLEGGPPELDISALFYLMNDKFWIGPALRTAWRSTDAVSTIVGVQVIDQLSIGYSFDYSISNTTFKYNSGSHEIMLRYDFIYNNKTRIKSPRYF